MSDTGAYTFLPWLRQGMARSVTAADGDTTVKLRATTPVELTLTGDAVSGTGTVSGKVTRRLELYGPGEVVGIDTRAIVRTDPHPWITDFEPNYLPAIEFYDEDFPWRYTPAAPDATKRRLRPWIALVVLKDSGDPATSEFRDERSIAQRPLPHISVPDFAPFPHADELWAWAHVHVNRSLATGPADLAVADPAAAVQKLATALAADPDVAYSRILAPRRLEVNAAYHAFLVPTFERGRLAGLGLDPDAAPFATASAWADYPGRPESLHLPYYHRWYFRTGGAGDFEALVRLLKWTTADPRVGHRALDVQVPGSGMPGIPGPELDGTLQLGGALRAPVSTLDTNDRERWKRDQEWAVPYPHEFQKRLARFIDLADDVTQRSALQARADAGLPASDPTDVDPLITPPIYGEWQSLHHRLLVEVDGTTPVAEPTDWVHDLNLDPRYRVPAGFGGDAIRAGQEDYMEAAWAQVGEVLAHNRRARIAQAWVRVGEAIQHKTVDAIAGNPTRLLGFTAPVQARVALPGTTARSARLTSTTPPVLTSSAWRRIVRPSGRVARRLELATGPHADTFLESVADGTITAAPPKQTPSGIATIDDLAQGVGAGDRFRDWLSSLVRRAPWLPWVLLGLGIVLVVLGAVFGLVILLVVGILIAAVGVVAWVLGRRPTISEALGSRADTVAAVDRLPTRPGFVFGSEDTGAPPAGSDDVASRRFVAALREWAAFSEQATAAMTPAPRVDLDLTKLGVSVRDRIRPGIAIPLRFGATSVLAPHVRDQLVETFDEVRYYPRIDTPMYLPLKTLGDELFVPGLNLIEPDTVVALETNQEFIESYMVGVNHEFSRELLWREYPTDQRGSTFRQFWDVAGHFDPTATDADALREKLYDIPPLHRWKVGSDLGEHDNRQPDPSTPRNEIVLAIRGQLLKKYPNTVVYAHRAQWARTPANHVDPTKERTLVDLTAAELEKPPLDKVKTPLYEAKVDPDIYFFGFDLVAEEAKGGPGDADTDDAGWFFVLKERPGETRFGLDEARKPGGKTFSVNDLAWTDTAVAPGGPLPATILTPVLVDPTGDDIEEKPQHDDDLQIVGKVPESAASWAYLLYQAPVMIAVHAAELLHKGGAS